MLKVYILFKTKMKVLLIAALCIAAVNAAGYTGPTNTAGTDLIKYYEGWHANFYTDPVGIRTIGYGHACHVWNCAVPLEGRFNVPLSLQSGHDLLLSDLRYPGRYEGCVNNQVSRIINANQFSALASFTFNLGCGNFGSSTLKTRVNAGDWLGASREFGKWINAGGNVLLGLVRRRETERLLFCGNTGSCNTGCKGRVVASGGLNVRKEPNTGAALVWNVADGTIVDIYGKTTGTPVNGNNVWYEFPNGFASGVYVTITQSSHGWCS